MPVLRCTGISHFFSFNFYKGNNLCDFLFAFMMEEAHQNGDLLVKGRICSWGANSFLYELIQIGKGSKNQNDRVTSPESVHIHLNTTFGWCSLDQIFLSHPSSKHTTLLFCIYQSGPRCSKLTTSLVNILLKFQMLIPQICRYFLLKKCEKLLHCKSIALQKLLLHCKSFSHFFDKKYLCICL